MFRIKIDFGSAEPIPKHPLNRVRDEGVYRALQQAKPARFALVAAPCDVGFPPRHGHQYVALELSASGGLSGHWICAHHVVRLRSIHDIVADPILLGTGHSVRRVNRPTCSRARHRYPVHAERMLIFPSLGAAFLMLSAPKRRDNAVVLTVLLSASPR